MSRLFVFAFGGPQLILVAEIDYYLVVKGDDGLVIGCSQRGLLMTLFLCDQC